MIRNRIKSTIVLIVTILTVTSGNAQSKFGEDENACKENLSIFREYYKQKNYADALKPWRWTYNNCPESSGNIYKNGPKIIKERIKEDQINKDAYIDTLMMIFDQRIQYGFGEEGYILGLKGYELVIADKSRSFEAFEILNKGVSLSGNSSDFRTVYGFMKAVVNLEKSGEKTETDVFHVYAVISEIIDYNIGENPTKAEKDIIDRVEKLFNPYANCKDLISLFSNQFYPSDLNSESKSDNINFLKRVANTLRQKNCIESELFFDVTRRLYDIEPSASSAYLMARKSVLKGNSSEAIRYAKQAVEMENDPNLKAKYYLVLADAYRSSGSFTSARNTVYSALKFRKGWGEAYMNLGNIYIAAASSCGNIFEQKTVYWVAVDVFKEALNDEGTKARASKSINTYSKYFPTTEICFFNGVESGKAYTVACWINKSTTARTSD